MKETRTIDGKEIETNIFKIEILESYENLYYEFGNNGEKAYIRISPDNHPCTEIKIHDKENLLMLTNALLHISSEFEKIADGISL